MRNRPAPARKAPEIFVSIANADLNMMDPLESGISSKYSFARMLPRVEDEPFSKVWLLRTVDRIRRADVVVFAIGEFTWLDNARCFEAMIAQMYKKRVVTVQLNPIGLNVLPFPLLGYPVRSTSLHDLIRPE